VGHAVFHRSQLSGTATATRQYTHAASGITVMTRRDVRDRRQFHPPQRARLGDSPEQFDPLCSAFQKPLKVIRTDTGRPATYEFLIVTCSNGGPIS